MEKDYLTLKRASISHRSGKERDDDYDVLADGVLVGPCGLHGGQRLASTSTAFSRRREL